MIEAALIGVPFVAAIVYLVVEFFDLKIWWNKRRHPEPPKRPPGMGDTWPEHRRAEAEERWRKMIDKDKE
jgi:hypothetical protein